MSVAGTQGAARCLTELRQKDGTRHLDVCVLVLQGGNNARHKVVAAQLLRQRRVRRHDLENLQHASKRHLSGNAMPVCGNLARTSSAGPTTAG